MSEPGAGRVGILRAVAVLGPRTVGAVVLGCGSAVLGAIAGLVLALHRRVAECTGDELPQGDDPNCYSYYDAAKGLSIMFACLALLLLVLLVARVLFVVQAGNHPAAPDSGRAVDAAVREIDDGATDASAPAVPT